MHWLNLVTGGLVTSSILAISGVVGETLSDVLDQRVKARSTAPARPHLGQLTVDNLRVKSELTNLDMRQRFEAMPPIDYALPLTFANVSSLESITLSCPQCDENVDEKNTRGEFLRIDFGYQLRSVSFCEKCNTYFWGRAYVLQTDEQFVIVGPPRHIDGEEVAQSPWPGDARVESKQRFAPPHSES